MRGHSYWVGESVPFARRRDGDSLGNAEQNNERESKEKCAGTRPGGSPAGPVVAVGRMIASS